MKREFILDGINCQAVLREDRMEVTVNIPHLTVTSHTKFKPLTPMGIKHQTFISAPERIAAQTISQCRPIWDTPTNQ